MNTSKFDDFDNQSHIRFSDPAVVQRDLKVLVGIVRGIEADGHINPVELEKLQSWLKEHRHQENKQPYKEVFELVRTSLADSILTQEECENIIWFCNQYVDETGYFTAITQGIQELTGIVRGITIDESINQRELDYLGTVYRMNLLLSTAAARKMKPS